MAYGDYPNAVNHSEHEIKYDSVDFTHMLRFKRNDIEVVEVKTTMYSGINTQKVIVNDTIKLYLHYGDTFKTADDSYGVYLNEADMMKDIVAWYNKRKELLVKYKGDYERMQETVTKTQALFKGKEEFLI